MNTTRRRIVAASAAFALGTLSLSTATAAHADVEDFGDIDAGRTGSLTVHKFLHQSGYATGDVSEAPADDDFTDPVAGVVFTVYPLLVDGNPLDLAVAEDWDPLDGVSAPATCTAPAGFALGDGTPMPATGATGTATLPRGLSAYLVCETNAPAHIVDTAAPFLLTVPLAAENGWVYDVHAYPKNGAGAIQKSVVAQEGLGLGATVRFPVTSAIPTMTGQSWSAYAISDTLDSRLAPVGVASVEVDGAELPAGHYQVSTSGQTIVVELTPAGIAWLDEGTHAGAVLEVVFEAVVAEVGDGAISNTADLWVNNPTRSSEVKPPLPSNEVSTTWGSLEMLKRAAGTTGTEGHATKRTPTTRAGTQEV